MPAEGSQATDLPGRRIEITIGAEDGGVRLDRALQRQLPELSRTRLKQLILSGQIAGDGKLMRDPAQRASSGTRVVVTLPEPDEPTPAAQPIALDIRFEGRASDRRRQAGRHGGASGSRQPEGHPRQCAPRALRPSLAGIGGVRRPGIVHRLDKDTSGLLVAAKTETAHRALSHDFALRRVERAYKRIRLGRAGAGGPARLSANIGRKPLQPQEDGGGGGKPAAGRRSPAIGSSGGSAPESSARRR